MILNVVPMEDLLAMCNHLLQQHLLDKQRSLQLAAVMGNLHHLPCQKEMLLIELHRFLQKGRLILLNQVLKKKIFQGVRRLVKHQEQQLVEQPAVSFSPNALQVMLQAAVDVKEV